MAAATSIHNLRDNRTSVVHSAPDASSWEFWRRAPHPALREIVSELWAGGIADALARHRTLPNGEVCLMIHVGPAQQMIERGGKPESRVLVSGFVSGLHLAPFTIESNHRNTLVAAARIRATAVAALFPRSAPSELVDQLTELSELIGASAASELCGRAGEGRDLGAALDVLEHWLLTASRQGRGANPIARAAAARIERARGKLRIDQLSRSLGVSPRRLHEIFVRDLGISPKRVARIARFRGALESICRDGVDQLAALALDAGYYDEAHLYRDFRELIQLTPAQYRAAHGDGLDGVDVIGS